MMQFMVRQGHRRYGGHYWADSRERWEADATYPATRWEDREDAQKVADELDSRVVCRLTLDEAKKKAAAETLRALADQFDRHGSPSFEIGRMRQRADELWPTPKKTTGRKGR